MKANRKSLNREDDAVSPVIAVILMVAITVVLAATVYVWVSGFGSNSGTPAKTLALTSNGAIDSDCDAFTVGDQTCKTYVIASGSPGLRWSDLSFTIDGAPLTFSGLPCNIDSVAAYDQAEYDGCTGAGVAAASDAAVMTAGNQIRIPAASGDVLRVLDSASNSIVLTLTVA